MSALTLNVPFPLQSPMLSSALVCSFPQFWDDWSIGREMVCINLTHDENHKQWIHLTWNWWTKHSALTSSTPIRPRKLDSVMLVTSSVTFKVKSQSLVFGVQTGNQPLALPSMYVYAVCIWICRRWKWQVGGVKMGTKLSTRRKRKTGKFSMCVH